MKAAVHERFGAPEKSSRSASSTSPSRPTTRCSSACARRSVNIAEWYAVTGRPWIARPTTGLRGPRDIRLGVDYAGVVEAVGKDVTEFRPGDEVFGGRSGAYAEYVGVKGRACHREEARAT